MPHRRARSALIWLSCGAAYTLAGCDGTLSMGGVVRDGDGKPIQGAGIRLQNSEEHATADGCFSIFEVVHPRPHKLNLRVEADGYVPLRAAIDSPGQAHVQIVLAKTAEGNPSHLQFGPCGCKAR